MQDLSGQHRQNQARNVFYIEPGRSEDFYLENGAHKYFREEDLRRILTLCKWKRRGDLSEIVTRLTRAAASYHYYRSEDVQKAPSARAKTMSDLAALADRLSRRLRKLLEIEVDALNGAAIRKRLRRSIRNRRGVVWDATRAVDELRECAALLHDEAKAKIRKGHDKDKAFYALLSALILIYRDLAAKPKKLWPGSECLAFVSACVQATGINKTGSALLIACRRASTRQRHIGTK